MTQTTNPAFIVDHLEHWTTPLQLDFPNTSSSHTFGCCIGVPSFERKIFWCISPGATFDSSWEHHRCPDLKSNPRHACNMKDHDSTELDRLTGCDYCRLKCTTRLVYAYWRNGGVSKSSPRLLTSRMRLANSANHHLNTTRRLRNRNFAPLAPSDSLTNMARKRTSKHLAEHQQEAIRD